MGLYLRTNGEEDLVGNQRIDPNVQLNFGDAAYVRFDATVGHFVLDSTDSVFTGRLSVLGELQVSGPLVVGGSLDISELPDALPNGAHLNGPQVTGSLDLYTDTINAKLDSLLTLKLTGGSFAIKNASFVNDGIRIDHVADGSSMHIVVSGSDTTLQVTAGDMRLSCASGIIRFVTDTLYDGVNALFENGLGLLDDEQNEFLILHKVADAVNHLSLTHAASAMAPILAAEGDDGSIGLRIRYKGSGKHIDFEDDSGDLAVRITGAANPTHAIVLTAGTADVSIATAGSGNFNLEIAAGGTGLIECRSDLDLAVNAKQMRMSGGTAIRDGNANELLQWFNVASAVNHVYIQNNIATARPIIAFTGDDTNVGGFILYKGSGQSLLIGSSVANAAVEIEAIASPTRRIRLSGSASGNVRISEQGTAADFEYDVPTGRKHSFLVNAAEEALLNASGLDVVDLVRAQSFRADGDAGGLAGTRTMTNATAALGSTPAVLGNVPTGVTATQAGWKKDYVGSTAVYTPYWVV